LSSDQVHLQGCLRSVGQGQLKVGLMTWEVLSQSSGSVGAPDSPVCPTDRWRNHVSREDYAADRCTGDRWLTGQSGAPPDSPVIFSRTPPSKSESSKFTGDQLGAPNTVRCTTGHCPVCQTELKFGCIEASLFDFFSSSFLTVSST
jgi:hypothetical protein